MSIKARQVRNAAVVTAIALIAVLLAWSFIPGVSPLRIGIAVAVTLPLVIFLPALLRDRRRGYAALTLCLVPYLVGALTELVANPGARVWAASTLLLAFTLFVLAIMYLRLTRSGANEGDSAPSVQA
jgi:uncharacterized membrane protein